ncbi:sensor histidine kinase [Treponema sp.]|uniref:sensor histidine kinase n=1 Tax=Treponema sp. TaxID=166 RepID=UPI00298E31C6|nr:ATP-binding protein [Treponema sp.]MCQ2242265.1 histidine kinase [Treponema sp.]
MTDAEKIAELESIIQNYTIFFLIFDIVFFALLVFGIVLAIRFIKSRKHLKDSNEFLLYTIHGQEEERERIARELHDTIAQNLRYCKSLCENSSTKDLKKLSDVLSKSLVEVRSMSYNLSPPDITKKDFLFCIKNLCEEFNEVRNFSIRLSIIEKTDASFLSKDEILNLYRIVQEALTNIIKHAKAEEAVIMIRNNNEEEVEGLYIYISDDGLGFDTENIDSRKHYGIQGMKKRASLIGATLNIDSTPGEGTQISIIKRR